MRLKSDIFVSGLIRSAQSAGFMASIVSRGKTGLGTVLVVSYDTTERHYSLWAPAPQTAFMVAQSEDLGAERLFERRLTNIAYEDIVTFVAKEKRIDDDVWVVELEMPVSEVEALLNITK